MSHGVAGDCRLLFLPMEEVLAHRMSPMHIAPFRAIRVILIVEVPHTILIEHAIGIVHPAIGGGVMVYGSIIISVDNAPLIREFYILQRDISRFETDNLYNSLWSVAKLERNIVVDFVFRKAHIHPGVGGKALVELDLLLGSVFLDRQNHILSWARHGYHRGVAFRLNVHCLCGAGQCRSNHYNCKKGFFHSFGFIAIFFCVPLRQLLLRTLSSRGF